MRKNWLIEYEWRLTLIFIIIFIFAAIILFSNGYIQPPQTFASIVSDFGHKTPFEQISLTLFCQPINYYFSEESDISCKIITKANTSDNFTIRTELKIKSENNIIKLTCDSLINRNLEQQPPCQDKNGRNNFEVPKGDYIIVSNKFILNNLQCKKHADGTCTVALTKNESEIIPLSYECFFANGTKISDLSIIGQICLETLVLDTSKETIFRGTLHIMSSYDRQNKQVEDGMALATFLAFLFIIPTGILELRRFLLEKRKKLKSPRYLLHLPLRCHLEKVGAGPAANQKLPPLVFCHRG